MKIIQRTLRLAAGLALLAGLLGAAQAQTLKIGVISPLTGGGAPWGVASAQAVKILAAEVNAKGGLQVGDKKYKVEVIAYDDQYKAAEAVSAYKRLVTQDGVKYLVVLSTPATIALRQNIEDDKVLALSSAGAGNAVEPGNKYLVRLLSILPDYVPPFVGWLKEHVKERRVVLLNPNDDSGWFSGQLGAKVFKDNGFEVLGSELFERTQKDFQPLLTKIMAMKADVLEVGSTAPATAGLIVRQAREMGFKGLIVKTSGPAPKDIVDAAGKEAAEGMLNILYADTSTEGYKRLAAEYRKAIGQDPNEMIVTFYDAANVLFSAIQKGGDVNDTAKARAAIAQVLPMKSAQGDTLGYSAAANQIMTVSYIGAIRNGVPVIVGKVK